MQFSVQVLSYISTPYAYVVVDVMDKVVDQFPTKAQAQVRADEMNAEYERVLNIL